MRLKCPNPLKQKRTVSFTIPEIYLTNYTLIANSQIDLKTAQLQLKTFPPNSHSAALKTDGKHAEEWPVSQLGPQLASELASELVSELDLHEQDSNDYISRDSVITLIFPDSNSLQYSLGRVHEDYEGNALKGPLKGVNFPATHWKSWIEKDKNDDILSENPFVREGEYFISKLFSSIPKMVYVVACIKGDRSSLVHEWAHFFYHINEDYRQIVKDLWMNLDKSVKLAIEKDLLMRNYDYQVIIDEFQAYLVETPTEFGKKWKDYLYGIHVKLRNIQPSFEKSKSTDTVFLYL